MHPRGALPAVAVAIGAVVLAGCSVPGAGEDDRRARVRPRTQMRAAGTDPAPRFKSVASKRGLPSKPTRSWGQLFADYNRNGYPDLLINRHMSRAWLYSNRGGRFVRHRENFTPHYVDRHNCAWGEANGDRRADLYCTVGAFGGKGKGPNQLYLQTKDGGFQNRARMYGVKYGPGRGRSVNWIDYDMDGKLDIYLTNAKRKRSPNVMFRNDGERFLEASIGVEEHLRTSSSTWTDWNQDGWPDLLVIQHGPIVAYENTGGSFKKVELPGVPHRAGRWKSASWGDFDGDGWPDLHLVGETRSLILRNGSGIFDSVHETSLTRGRMSVWLDVDNNGRLDAYVVQGAKNSRLGSVNRRNFMIVQRKAGFERIHKRSFRGPRKGNGDSAVAADFDRDGRVDLFVSNGHRPKQWRGRGILLRNVTSAMNQAALELRGPPGNPWGMGAKVRVEGTGIGYWRHVTDGVSARVQSDPGYLDLGLGTAAQAIARIEWPDGQIDCVTLRAGDTTTAAHGSRPCM